MPIPGEPDAPKLWLVRTADTSFVVEWSEPKSYGIPVIGFQLYIEGRQAGEMIKLNLHRAEIPSNVNRTYQVNICAVTNNPQRKRSTMSQTLSVLTTPPITTNSSPPTYYNTPSQKALTRTMPQIIPIEVESMNEDKLHLDWSDFFPLTDISAYYVHYTCLNNGEIQTMRVSKRNRHAVRKIMIKNVLFKINFIRLYKI